jgi:hypothetical protein
MVLFPYSGESMGSVQREEGQRLYRLSRSPVPVAEHVQFPPLEWSRLFVELRKTEPQEGGALLGSFATFQSFNIDTHDGRLFCPDGRRSDMQSGGGIARQNRKISNFDILLDGSATTDKTVLAYFRIAPYH